MTKIVFTLIMLIVSGVLAIVTSNIVAGFAFGAWTMNFIDALRDRNTDKVLKELASR